MSNRITLDFSQNGKNNLDAKAIARIERLSGQQIEALESKHMKVLTHDFDESYVRLIVAKGKTIVDQQKLLEAIRGCFMDEYEEGDSFGNYYMQREIPSYFEEWEAALAFGEPIAAETEMPMPASQPVQQAESIAQMLDEEGMLKHWMSMSMKQLSASMRATKEEAEGILAQIKALRDGSITRLSKQIEESEAALRASEEKCRQMENQLAELQNNSTPDDDSLGIEALKQEVKALKAENHRLRCQTTEERFLKRLVSTTKKVCKHERIKADIVRHILQLMKRYDAVKELDAFIEGNSQPLVGHADQVIVANQGKVIHTKKSKGNG